MAIKVVESSINVVEAAKIRIKNIFDTGRKIYLSFSSGKDSLCVSSLILDMIKLGEINPQQLTVIFIDEELVYQDMLDAAMRWKRFFEAVGVRFVWLCLPFKQTSVIDSLSCNESWITWDPKWKHLWTRNPPPFAVVQSKYIHYPGEMNYQTFCQNAFGNGIQVIGIRMAESYARIKAIAETRLESIKKFYPIYDWRDTDVWRYIRDRNLEFPKVYMKLYEAGVRRDQLRLCNFFGEGSTAGLPMVSEIDPDEWDRICKREPNAQLALLYWDSEMFGRKTSTRKELEKDEQKNYRELLEDLLFKHTNEYVIGEDTKKMIRYYRRLYMKAYYAIEDADCKRMYEWIIFGDPKQKGIRTVPISIFTRYNERAKKEDNNGKGKSTG